MRGATTTIYLALAVVLPLMASASAFGALVPGSPPFGAPGTVPGAFSQPGGVAFTATGDLWVADTGNGRLQRFTRSGTLIKIVGGFVAPTGVAVGPDGAVYVADAGAGSVMKLQPDGATEPQFEAIGLPDVRAVAVDPRGEALYVVEGASGRLQELSSVTGASRTLISADLQDPTGVAVDASGIVAVVERAPGRVRLLPPEDGSWRALGPSIVDRGELDRPTGVAFDPYGSIVIAEAGRGRIVRLTQKGSVIDEIGGFGSPVAVAFDDVQTVAVADVAGGRIAFASDVLPPPELGRTANVARLEGVVTVRIGREAPRVIGVPKQIPLGAEIDTTRGTVRFVTARAEGGTQRATLFKGRFRTAQPRSGVPTVTLTGDQLRACRGGGSTSGAVARLPSPEPPPGKPRRAVRTNVKGKFRTNGSAAAADVKGTDYEVADYCSGTLVTVYTGVVKVTRRRDGASRIVRGSLSQPGRIFVKRSARRRTRTA